MEKTPYLVKTVMSLQILQPQNESVSTNVYKNAPEHEEADRLQVNVY